MIYNLQVFLIYAVVVFVLTLVVISLNDAVTGFFAADFNKKSPYECGFKPFDSSLQQFDIKYYIVALLFLIFDVETLFLIPYITILNYSNLYVFYNVFFFLLVLFVGLLYEWKNNFLEWE